LDPYTEIIKVKYDNYACTAMSIYYFIKKNHGYDGYYDLIKKFLSVYKDNQNTKATIRVETSPGLQAQVDWL